MVSDEEMQQLKERIMELENELDSTAQENQRLVCVHL